MALRVGRWSAARVFDCSCSAIACDLGAVLMAVCAWPDELSRRRAARLAAATDPADDQDGDDRTDQQGA